MPEVLEVNFANLFIAHSSLTTLKSLKLRGLLADGKKTVDTAQTLYSFTALHLVNSCILNRTPNHEQEYLDKYEVNCPGIYCLSFSSSPQYELQMAQEYVSKVQDQIYSMVADLKADAKKRDKKYKEKEEREKEEGEREREKEEEEHPFEYTANQEDDDEEDPPPSGPPPPSPLTTKLQETSPIPPWARLVRPLTFNAPLFRGLQQGQHMNLYPWPAVIPELACSSDKLAYASADLEFIGGYFHSRAYVLRFSRDRFFVVCLLSSTFCFASTCAVTSCPTLMIPLATCSPSSS